MVLLIHNEDNEMKTMIKLNDDVLVNVVGGASCVGQAAEDIASGAPGAVAVTVHGIQESYGRDS